LRRAQRAAPCVTLSLNPTIYSNVNENTATGDFPPLGLRSSGVACWWSIRNLIAAHSPCYLWTFTTPVVYPDFYYGHFHSKLLRLCTVDAIAGRMPPVRAVRVIEEHPGGHGLHFHWVAAGRLPVERLRYRAQQSGFGRIHVHPDPCSKYAANYLAKYLVKNDRLHGVRMWANIGAWDGTQTRDIECVSDGVRVFRDAFRHARGLGKSRAVAFNEGKVAQMAYVLKPFKEEKNHDDPF